MGQLARWKRRYRKAKKVNSTIVKWFSNDPMASTHRPGMVVTQTKTGKRGAWKTQKISAIAKYPDPSWITLESGLRVYGPVRDENGDWGYYDAKGNQIYSKADKARDGQYVPTTKGITEDRRKALQKKYPAPTPTTQKKTKGRLKMCGKMRTSDGKKCRRRGNCPHHRNHVW